MNQILVTEKLYVTPELKRKRAFYKISFMLSIFVIVILSSLYIYAEYDKTKSEDISQDILSELTVETEEQIASREEEEEAVWKIILSTAEEQEDEDDSTETSTDTETTTKYGIYTLNGVEYKTVGSINIPAINVNYPILSETTTALLKISPCKFFGPDPNEVGNLCIAGHNYKTDQFFSHVQELVYGDVIEITDLTGRTLKYSVYDKYTVVPEDTDCTSQDTDGKKIVTLITCTNDNKKRVIVHAKEII